MCLFAINLLQFFVRIVKVWNVRCFDAFWITLVNEIDEWKFMKKKEKFFFSSSLPSWKWFLVFQLSKKAFHVRAYDYASWEHGIIIDESEREKIYGKWKSN